VARPGRSPKPSVEDWKHAVSLIRLIRAFENADYRASLGQLVRVLEREGIAAHRSADRLEKRSKFSRPVCASDHAREAIIKKLSSHYDDDSSDVISGFVPRLFNDGLSDPERLRQQAAILLDAAETVESLLTWYGARLKTIGARSLTSDTIVAIMLEWDLRPRETSRRLKVHGVVISEGAIKQALSKGRGRSLPGQEPTLLSFEPLLHRPGHSAPGYGKSHETPSIAGSLVTESPKDNF